MVHTLAPFHPTASALMLGQGGACRKVAFLRFSCLGLKGQTKPWGSPCCRWLCIALDRRGQRGRGDVATYQSIMEVIIATSL